MARKSITVLLLIALAVVAIVAAGCEAPKPALNDIVMTKTVEKESMKPTGVTSTFKPSDPDIYCVGKLENGEPNSEIKYDWVYLEGGKVDVASIKLKADGDRYVASTVTKPTEGWPTGKYEVTASLNGKKVKTVSFEVK